MIEVKGNRIEAPIEIIRTTLDKIEDIPDVEGIYLIAYMGRILYVGKSFSVPTRIVGHYLNALDEKIGRWLVLSEFDCENTRIDILVAPLCDDVKSWLRIAEGRLIRKFDPIFNTMLCIR